ncbi:MAG: hypothetical protein KDA45_13070 [Planctomycetales bacterium]|nr:hypothetical protein [Planctomycetales bacterium]
MSNVGSTSLIPLGVVLLSLCALGSGCSTHAQRLVAPRHAFYTDNLPQAQTQLGKLAAKPKGDENVVELDLAMVELLQGDPASAEQRLRRVRDRLDHLEQKSLAEAATSLLTDDQRRAYSGEDYEKLLLRVFLTLSSLLQDGVDATSYSLQTMEKHDRLVEQAQSRWGEEVPDSYCIPPIAPYLWAVTREASFHNYDDALRGYQRSAELLPAASFLQADIARVTHGVHSAAGQGVVYVIALVGRGPYKVEVEEHASQQALLLADQMLSALGKYSLPPTLAPIKIPQIVSPSKPFDLLGVEVDGQARATTLPITDLQLLATETYAAKLPEVMARTVARRVVKKGAIYAAKDQLEVNSSLASLAMDAAGVLWEASESADTRCWGLLPREIQVLRLELPVGEHRLLLEPVTAGRPVAAGVPCSVQVADGRNTYVLSYWPDLQPIGQVLVSGNTRPP